MKNDIKDLQLVLDAKVRLVAIESWDEQRVLETLTSVAVQRGTGLVVWFIFEGMRRLGFKSSRIENTTEVESALRYVKADTQQGLYVFLICILTGQIIH